LKRLFAGIKYLPDEDCIGVIEALKTELAADEIRWASKDNYHITLWFFGETGKEKIQSLCEVLQQVSSNTKAFEFKTVHPGIFGSRYTPRLIWLGIEPQSNFVSLHKTIEVSLRQLNYVSNRQNFIPHISLCRIKKLKDKVLFMDAFEKFKKSFVGNTLHVSYFSLFESILTPEGPIYKEINVFEFNKKQISRGC
jgi:2'-5' RNA ligase